jgi:signal transduction histidine kinase
MFIYKSKLKRFFFWSFLIAVIPIAAYIITYLNISLRKAVELRDKLFEEKYEGALSENIGFTAILATEIADELKLDSIEEQNKYNDIKGCLLKLKETIKHDLEAAVPTFSVDQKNFNIETVVNTEELGGLLDPDSLESIDIKKLNLIPKYSQDYPTRPYLQSADSKTSPKTDPVSFVFVPSQLVSTRIVFVSFPFQLFSVGLVVPTISNTIKREIIFSKMIEPYLYDIFTKLEKKGINNIYQAYFIPLSGFVRILNKNKKGLVNYYKKRLYGAAIFSNRLYFWKTMEESFRRSKLYVDSAGGGIVITYSVFIRNEKYDVIGMIGIDRKFKPLEKCVKNVKLGSWVFPKDFKVVFLEYKNIRENEEKYFKDKFSSEKVAEKIREETKKGEKLFERDPIVKVPIEKEGVLIYLMQADQDKIACFVFNTGKIKNKYLILTIVFGFSLLIIVTFIFVIYGFYRKISKTEKTHTEVISHLNGGLIIIDRNGKIKFHNPQMGELVKESNLSNRNFLTEYLTEESQIEFKRLNERVNTKKSFEYPGRIKRADDTVFRAIITSTTIEYPGVKAPQMLIIIPSGHLERTIAAKFIHSISHSLKTPIASILLLADRLRRKKALKKFDYYYSLMQEQVDVFTTMLTNLLGFSRLEFDKDKIHKEEVNLAAMLRSTVKPFVEKTKNKNLELEQNIPERIIANVDRGMFRVILNNLLENALKYTDEGKISVKAHDDWAEVTIIISDTGIGVPDDERDRIFDKFYRGRSEKVQNKDGIGLGLFLSKNYIELHNGNLTYIPGKEKVKTKLGVWIEKERGSVFTIQIPKKS